MGISDKANLLSNIAASEEAANAPQTPAKPGILIITLHEGKGFSLPPGAEKAFTQRSAHGSSLSTGGGFSIASNRPTSRDQAGLAGSYAQGRPQSATGGINSAPTVHGRYSSKYLPYALLDFDKQQVFINAVSGTPENPIWAGDNTQYKFDVSRVTDLTVQLYIRNPNASPNAGRSEDIFIGTAKIKPRFEEVKGQGEAVKGGKGQAENDKSLGQVGADWLEVQYGTGNIKVGVEFVENRQKSLAIDDFELLKVVGKGSFGKVMQVMCVPFYLHSFASPPLTVIQEEGHPPYLRPQNHS